MFGVYGTGHGKGVFGMRTPDPDDAASQASTTADGTNAGASYGPNAPRPHHLFAPVRRHPVIAFLAVVLIIGLLRRGHSGR